MTKSPMHSENELLRELQRLNRSGVINDEEFLILRKIIRSGAENPEHFRRFDQLFVGNSNRPQNIVKSKKRDAQSAVSSSESEERLYSITEAINELNLKLLPQYESERDHELLTCPACGMFENTAADGRIITAEPNYPEDDTGLSFTKVNAEEWECPDCGYLFANSFSGKGDNDAIKKHF